MIQCIIKETFNYISLIDKNDRLNIYVYIHIYYIYIYMQFLFNLLSNPQKDDRNGLMYDMMTRNKRMGDEMIKIRFWKL